MYVSHLEKLKSLYIKTYQYAHVLSRNSTTVDFGTVVFVVALRPKGISFKTVFEPLKFNQQSIHTHRVRTSFART